MKKPLGYLTIIILFAACEKESEIEPEITDPYPFMISQGEPALVIAHRGGKSLRPENTMEAFNNAVNIGVDVLEMDVVLTKDCVLVTIHDVTIDNTSDSTGNVSEYTFQELQQLNFGYQFQDANGSYPYRGNPVRIPRLEDVFIQHPDELISVEIKDLGDRGKLAGEKLNALISTYSMASKVITYSFIDEVMAHLHSINTENYFTGATFSESFNFVTAAMAGNDSSVSVTADVFAFPTNLIGIDLTSDTIIQAVHRHSVAIHYWTINDKEEMKSLILKGADGIITDKPDLMQEALMELGF